MNERDKQRKRALIVFQIMIYGFMIGMFALQLSMLFTRDW